MPVAKAKRSEPSSRMAQMSDFMAKVEQAAIDLAEKEQVEIWIDHDTRGRYANLTIRAIKPAASGELVLTRRKVNGTWYKP